MQIRRQAHERGHFKIDWLDSWHTFSFGEYFDPQHMGWGPLRVINDDTVAPKGGFAPHSHQDMEIISYVLEGELEHRDSLGTGSVIRPGEIQRMRAGSGIRHSEFNPSAERAVHFLQIWIVPQARGLAPNYAQSAIPEAALADDWVLIAGPEGSEALVEIASPTRVHATRMKAGQRRRQALSQPLAYLHIASGRVELNGQGLVAGDGVYFRDETEIFIEGRDAAEVLLFSLPAN